MSAPLRNDQPCRLLLIRRDNIGDLVLVTPLIHALRQRYPQSWIGVLGNSYNAPVLAGHPDIDEVFAYDKAKHQPDRSRISVYADTARLLMRLRARRIDIAILAGPGPQLKAARLAAWLGPRATLGFVDRGVPSTVSIPVPYGTGALLHEAEDVFRLGAALGIEGPPGPAILAADPSERRRCIAAIAGAGGAARQVVALHISARRPRQRWPAERFAELMRCLALSGAFPLLLWSPGATDDPRHPGDDEKAARIRHILGTGVPYLAWPTATLRELSGALSSCRLMVCADGGAMHVAAGLGLAVVAMFGDSPVARWRPWGVEARVLQAPSKDVRDLAVADVRAACESLLGGLNGG